MRKLSWPAATVLAAVAGAVLALRATAVEYSDDVLLQAQVRNLQEMVRTLESVGDVEEAPASLVFEPADADAVPIGWWLAATPQENASWA